MKIVIAGGSGFIGSRLVSKLAATEEVILLTRSSRNVKSVLSGKIRIQEWDGESQGEWSRCIDGADAVINLCGAGIADARWSPSRKTLLRDSRLNSTQEIVEAIRAARVKPKVLINFSAVGYYGSTENLTTENSAQGDGFLPELCAAWEAVALEAKAFGVRVVLPRIGIVLGREDGMLAKMLPAFEWHLGGVPGSGKQWVSWIHIQDVVNLVLFALKNESLSGPLNVCSPDPVLMEEFCGYLGKVLKKPSWLNTPAVLLRILLGEMACIVLEGQNVIPEKALSLGFKFRFKSLESALLSLLS